MHGHGSESSTTAGLTCWRLHLGNRLSCPASCAAEKLGVAHRGRTPATRGQHGRVADNKVAATISKVRIPVVNYLSRKVPPSCLVW